MSGPDRIEDDLGKTGDAWMAFALEQLTDEITARLKAEAVMDEIDAA